MNKRKFSLIGWKFCRQICLPLMNTLEMFLIDIFIDFLLISFKCDYVQAVLQLSVSYKKCKQVMYKYHISHIMKQFKKIFVTVGTTEFNDLIKIISGKEVYEILKNQLKCEELTLQIGRGEEVSFNHFNGIKVNIYRLKESISDDINGADLVCSSIYKWQLKMI